MTHPRSAVYPYESNDDLTFGELKKAVASLDEKAVPDGARVNLRQLVATWDTEATVEARPEPVVAIASRSRKKASA
jgi:hypothetical protein